MQLFRYLIGTSDHGLVCRHVNRLLNGHMESDCNDGTADQKSSSGYFVSPRSFPPFYGARKLASIPLYTGESQNYAMVMASHELLWLSRKIDECGIPTTFGTSLPSAYVDMKFWAVADE